MATPNKQFKEFRIIRPAWLGEQWHDSSWHNDAMPHGTLYLTADESNDAPVIECWVNYAKRSDREIGDRYMVVFQKSYACESGADELLWHGDDEETAKMYVRAAELAKTIIADILARPRCNAATDFANLHDYCDANVIGNQEQVLIDAEKALAVAGWAEGDARDEQALANTFDEIENARHIADLWLRLRSAKRV